jgi:hypothetical protein
MDKKIIEKYRGTLLNVSVENHDNETLCYLLDNYNVSLDYSIIVQLNYRKEYKIIKEYFKKDFFNRKTIKKLITNCAEMNNLEMIKFYIDECDIFPTLSCFRRSIYNGNNGFPYGRNRIRQDKKVFNYLLNHKTFPDIYSKYKDNIDDDETLSHFMMKRIRELKIKRVKKSL